MKKMMTVVFASALAANALALTTNVSTVAELEAALVYMNKGGTYAKAGNVVQLAAGSYDVTGLDVQYWHTTGGTLTNSNAHLGISRFTLKGATDIRGCPRLRDGLVDLGCYEC